MLLCPKHGPSRWLLADQGSFPFSRVGLSSLILLWLARQRGAHGIWEVVLQFSIDPTFELCLAQEVYICVHGGIVEKEEHMKITVAD